MTRERHAAVDTGAAPRRVLVAMLAALVLSGLTACTAGRPPATALPVDDRPVFSGVRTLSNKPMALPWAPDLRTVRWDLVDRNAAGPHYRTKVAWTATTNGLDTRDAATFGIEALRAAPGEQLLLAVVGPTTAGTPFDEPEADPTRLEVAVDGTVTPVDLLPPVERRAGLPPVHESTVAVLMVGARPDAAVRLRLTDAGRVQEIDLRSGRVDAGPDGPLVERWGVANWRADVPVVLRPGEAGAVRVGSNAGPSASLTTYLPGNGWAAPGRAFLDTPRILVFYEPADRATRPRDRSSVSGRFDDADVFAFRTADGTHVPALARQRDLGGTDRGADSVVFDVPADTRAGTVVLDLGRPRLTVWLRGPDSSTTPVPVDWDGTPARVELPLTLDG